MSRLDYRRIEVVECAGIPISTFLSDDRSEVMVSISDMRDNLALNITDLDRYDNIQEYVAYDSIGQKSTHLCTTHDNVNEFLWMHDCKESFVHDLEEFRKFFSYEVMSFWKRFKGAAESLSVRDAVKVIDRRTSAYHDTLDLPPGRVYQLAFESLGYTRVPNKDTLTTEELSFVAFSELIYASVAASEQADGADVHDSMSLADQRLEGPLRALGNITRGISGI